MTMSMSDISSVNLNARAAAARAAWFRSPFAPAFGENVVRHLRAPSVVCNGTRVTRRAVEAVVYL